MRFRDKGDPPNSCGGFDYFIDLLEETGAGNQCGDVGGGSVSTCDGERTAIGFFILDDFPEQGFSAFCRFIAEVTATGFKTTGAYCAIEDEAPEPDVDVGYSSKVSLKGKAKDPKCTP